MIKVELDDTDAQALFVRLRDAAADLKPLMQQIGEHLAETTKQRFATSTGPDGAPWAPNAESTYVQLAGRYKGSLHKKGPNKGRVNKGGAARMAGKKPLIGETRALSTTINYRAGSDYVEIGSGRVYAAVQQFGAKKHSFTGGKTPWADIPARPFLGLSAEDEAYLRDAAIAELAKAEKGG